MGLRRSSLAVIAGLVATTSVLVAPNPASADGTTVVPATCTGIPVVGTLDTSVDVNATDDVDPVVSGGQVKLSLKVPIPVGDVPVSATITETKITTPIPSGVSVAGVAFTSSSFSSQTWALSGSNLVLTLSGSVKVGGSNPTPTMPDVTVTANVSGAPRVIEWKVPSTITAKGSAVIIVNTSFTATCTPKNTSMVLATTTVVAPNVAPVATDQTVPVAYETATPVKLTGTDANGDTLTFAVASQPSHGDLTGTAPNLTYTPDSGFSGTDSFTFTASDAALSDTGTITLQVSSEPATIPGAPEIDGVDVLGEGAARVRWSPPTTDGGSPITGYHVTVTQNGVETDLGTFSSTDREATSTALKNGVAATFEVSAVNGVGEGAPATSAAATPQWWLPWSSGQVAIVELWTWMTGKPPTYQDYFNWLSQLDGGFKTTTDLITYLRTTTDATNNVDPTIRLYSAYLTRIPDANGLNFWLGRRRAGWTLSKISSNFAASSEFIRRYGSMTNRQFVENIYVNVMERAGDTAGIAFWTRQLDNRRYSRGQVMINFSESSEYMNKQGGNVAAAAFYIHVLGRAPSLQERADFIQGIVDHGFAAVVRPLLRTESFAARAG